MCINKKFSTILRIYLQTGCSFLLYLQVFMIPRRKAFLRIKYLFQVIQMPIPHCRRVRVVDLIIIMLSKTPSQIIPTKTLHYNQIKVGFYFNGVVVFNYKELHLNTIVLTSGLFEFKLVPTYYRILGETYSEITLRNKLTYF